jgi:hypothetical protein
MMELRGKHVRIAAWREYDTITIEIAAIWDTIYRNALVIVLDKDKAEEKLREIAEEIRQLLTQVDVDAL